ncbi:MAG: hypothetical protein HY747_04720 [Elusimicrobia bacterium]|nr:hypothetical protein [Elusimicrobiota bacterium]
MILGLLIVFFLFEPAVQAKKPPSFDRFLPKFSKTIESGNFSSYPKEDIPVLEELKKIFPKDASALKCQQIEKKIPGAFYLF